jgi:pyruvate/2-oxoglutarate dehydrogenase complex dihydrolipoamide acyltransferase (E2) component
MRRDLSQAGYEVKPFPMLQRQQIDWLDLMNRQHTIHALLEVDITDARQSIREYRSKTGEPLSFTAFVVWCVARAVEADKRMHAYRKGRGRLVLFDDVDVTVPVERTVEGTRIPVPYIVRAANTKEPTEIHQEIRTAHGDAAPQALAMRWLPLWLLLPGFLRRLVWATLLGNPHRRKKVTGTVAVTAVGMFGRAAAWGIPLTSYTLCVTVGGITRKPGVVRDGPGRRDERIEVREYLSLTLSTDHDVVDGAPAARFAAHLKELIEGGVNRIDGSEGADPGQPTACHRRWRGVSPWTQPMCGSR